MEEDDDGGVDLYGLMQARLGWPVAVSELLGLVAAAAGARHHQSAHRPAAHRQCCKHQSTHRHTDTPTVLLSQQDKEAKSIQDRQIPKWQYNKVTPYQCFKPHQWNQRHTQCVLLQKKIFNEYQSITQVRHSMVFFVKT